MGRSEPWAFLAGATARVLRWHDEEFCDVTLSHEDHPPVAQPPANPSPTRRRRPDAEPVLRARLEPEHRRRFPRLARTLQTPGALVILDARHRIVSGFAPRAPAPAPARDPTDESTRDV